MTDTKEEYESSSDCSSGDETLSGESRSSRPGQDDWSGETMSKRPRERILFGESTSERSRDRILRSIMNKSEDDDAESIGSSDDSQSQLSQSWENGSETASNSDVSEIAIHSLLEWKQRGLDREMH